MDALTWGSLYCLPETLRASERHADAGGQVCGGCHTEKISSTHLGCCCSGQASFTEHPLGMNRSSAGIPSITDKQNQLPLVVLSTSFIHLTTSKTISGKLSTERIHFHNAQENVFWTPPQCRLLNASMKTP